MTSTVPGAAPSSSSRLTAPSAAHSPANPDPRTSTREVADTASSSRPLGDLARAAPAICAHRRAVTGAPRRTQIARRLLAGSSRAVDDLDSRPRGYRRACSAFRCRAERRAHNYDTYTTALPTAFERLFRTEIKIAGSLLDDATVLPQKRLLGLASRYGSGRCRHFAPAGSRKALAATLNVLCSRIVVLGMIMMFVPSGGTSLKWPRDRPDLPWFLQVSF